MSKITLDNLSDNLKAYLEGSGLTEEELKAMLKDTMSINELNTNSKTVIGAINELFQSANNGKQLIASAIGEPLSSNDTFSAMSNDINGLLSTFKTNMMNSGVTVESGDKFKQLIDKIVTMVEEGSGKGIQYVEAHLEDSIYVSGSTTTLSYNYSDLGINFIPTFLIFSVDGVLFINGTSIGNVTYRLTKTETGFSMGFTTSSAYSAVTVYDFKCYAIGVGEEDTTLRDSLADILGDKGVEVNPDDDMASLISKVEQRLEEGEVFKEGTTNCIDLSMLPYRHHNDDGTLSTQITTRLFTFLNKGTVTFKFNVTGWSNTVYAMVYLEQYNVNHELVYKSDLFSVQGSDRTIDCSVTMNVNKGDYVFIVPHSSSEGGYISNMKMYYD